MTTCIGTTGHVRGAAAAARMIAESTGREVSVVFELSIANADKPTLTTEVCCPQCMCLTTSMYDKHGDRCMHVWRVCQRQEVERRVAQFRELDVQLDAEHTLSGAIAISAQPLFLGKVG